MIKPEVQENVIESASVVVAVRNSTGKAQAGKLTLTVDDKIRACKVDGDGPADTHDVTLTANEERTVTISDWGAAGDSGKQFDVTIKADTGNASHRRKIH